MRTAPKDPYEIKLVRFEFSTEIEAGATITGIERSITTRVGSDPSPENVPLGAMVVDNENLFGLQLVQGGVDGCEYEIRALATDSNGLKHLVVATLPVAVQH